ncbi:hypothetical protein SAMN05444955_109128 [Lihuaxuella thermophila]|uniref:Uncharacterized protein n=1 Tax=Lihuaxuella thermophila TaxID=1173111 RepID=A0A1H8FX24_9BACL|nr:hypothetical protein SAMN05444955_109128 [Lihuaxuella thermophila]
MLFVKLFHSICQYHDFQIFYLPVGKIERGFAYPYRRASKSRYIYNSDNLTVSMTRGGKPFYYQLNYRGDVVALTDAKITLRS